jgi:hypothetical protein
MAAMLSLQSLAPIAGLVHSQLPLIKFHLAIGVAVLAFVDGSAGAKGQ